MSRVGYVYDEEMEKHENMENKKHPENPDRIRVPLKMLKESGTLAKCTEITSRYSDALKNSLCSEVTFSRTNENK